MRDHRSKTHPLSAFYRWGTAQGGEVGQATERWAQRRAQAGPGFDPRRIPNPAGQRVWKRVEDARTPQGHLLEADVGGYVWQAYQQADGQWVLTGGGYQAPLYFREWSDVRAFVEGGAATAPQPNPIDPLTAAAAATGAAIAMRSHLVNNPGRPHDLAYDQGYRDAVNFAPSRASSLAGGVKERYKQGFADGLRDRK